MARPPPPSASRPAPAGAVPTIPTLIAHTLGADVLAALCRAACERGCAPDERCLALWDHRTGEMRPAL